MFNLLDNKKKLSLFFCNLLDTCYLLRKHLIPGIQNLISLFTFEEIWRYNQCWHLFYPFLFQTISAPTNSSKRLSLPVLHYGTSLNDISMRKSPAHRTRSSTEFGSSKSPPYSSEQHLSRRSRRMSLVSL